jgi:DNA-binding NarL/FixJ family response regulator
MPGEGVGGVPDVGLRASGPDGGDRFDRVPALSEQYGEAERRAAVDAHVAVSQHDGIRVLDAGALNPTDGVLEPLRRNGLSGVVHAVVQVAGVGGVGGEHALVRALEPHVDNVRHAELAQLLQLQQGDVGVADVEVAADSKLRGDEVDVGVLGHRECVHEVVLLRCHLQRRQRRRILNRPRRFSSVAELERQEYEELKRLARAAARAAGARDEVLVADQVMERLAFAPEEVVFRPAWVRTAARRLAIDEHRARERRGGDHDVLDDDGTDEWFPSPSAEVRRTLLVEQLLGQLSSRDAQLLRDWGDGWSAVDLAERYELTPATVQVTLTRAKNRLRAVADRDAADLD